VEIQDKDKVKHLFLLVGENPLPNYVAAKLLLENEGEKALYLVHTSGTDKRAIDLKRVLIKDSLGLSDEDIKLVFLEDESDAYHIKEKISQHLNKIKDKNIKIGLNYTGGTKAMSVHSYRALFYQEEKEENKAQYTNRQNVVFSYLDARHLKMRFDSEDRKREGCKIKPEMLQVSLDTVLELHGWQKRSDANAEAEQFDEAARAFAKFYQQPDDARKFYEWSKSCKKNEVLNVDVFNSDPLIKDALKKLGVAENTLKDGKLENWLKGTWLEYFVFWQVKKISKNLNIHDKAVSIPIIEAGSKKDRFEIDVAFMRGYQLFAISCTTDIPLNEKEKSYIFGIYKQKLFEIYIRARQLGGDEARVALVCPADKKDVKKLEKQILNLFNPDSESSKKDHRLKVFGREDLMDLSAKIEQWIKNVDKETE